MVERLEVHAPERAGWIQRLTKLRSHRLDRLFLTSLVAVALRVHRVEVLNAGRRLGRGIRRAARERWWREPPARRGHGRCARRQDHAADAEASALRDLGLARRTGRRVHHGPARDARSACGRRTDRARRRSAGARRAAGRSTVTRRSGRRATLRRTGRTRAQESHRWRSKGGVLRFQIRVAEQNCQVPEPLRHLFAPLGLDASSPVPSVRTKLPRSISREPTPFLPTMASTCGPL